MATVTTFTADRLQQIEDNVITGADIVGGDLILQRYDGTTLNAGPIAGAILNPSGDWDIAQTYNKSDLVYHNSATWLATDDVAAGLEPGVYDVWQEFAVNTTYEWEGPLDESGSVATAIDVLTSTSRPDARLELRAIKAALSNVTAGGKAKIAVLGDSISRQPSWVQMARDLAALYNSKTLPSKAGRRSVQTDAGGLTSDRIWDKPGGTWVSPKHAGGMAPGSSLMAVGEWAEHTTYCDRFSIILGTTSGGTVNIYVDGSLIDSVSPTLFGDLWDSPPLLWDEHTIRIEIADAPVMVHQTYFYAGNYTSGVQVWDLGASGALTENILRNNDDAVFGDTMQVTLGYLGTIDPDAVIIAFGTNDVNDLATYTATPSRLDDYDADTRELIDKLRTNIPNMSIILWVPYAAEGRTHWPLVRDVARDIAKDTGVALIDSYTQLGDAADAGLGMMPDGVHPGPKAHGLISDLATTLIKTRATPLHVGDIEPVWSNATDSDPIDMGKPWDVVTIYNPWSPSLVRSSPASGQVRASKLMVRSASGDTITWPAELNWDGGGTGPSLLAGEWALIEMVHLPSFGPLAWVLSTGVWTPDPPITLVDWHAAYNASDASANGDGNVLTSTWVDASGNGRDLSVLTAAPTYDSSYPNLNGQPAVVFSGGQNIKTVSMTGDQIHQPFSVVAFVVPTSQVTQRILSTVQGNGRGIGVQTVGNWTWQGSSTLRISSTGGVTSNVPVLIEAYANGASSELHINGTSVASGDAGSDVINIISLGATGGATPANHFFGALAFAGIMSGDHSTDTDWAILRAALANKYGVSLA